MFLSDLLCSMLFRHHKLVHLLLLLPFKFTMLNTCGRNMKYSNMHSFCRSNRSAAVATVLFNLAFHDNNLIFLLLQGNIYHGSEDQEVLRNNTSGSKDVKLLENLYCRHSNWEIIDLICPRIFIHNRINFFQSTPHRTVALET